MEKLPSDLFLKIFCWLDHQNLTAAQLGQLKKSVLDWKWRDLASDEVLWSNLFKERWGIERATFYAPAPSQSWKDVYIVQDRCDRVGLGLKIIREGDDYYLVHQGQIQRNLGSRREVDPNCKDGERDAESVDEEVPSSGILDKILFFIGDMETASMHAKRNRLL